MRSILITMLTIGCRTVNTEDGFVEIETETENETETETGSTEGSISNNQPILSLTPGVSAFTLNQVVAGETVERRFLVHTPDDFDDSISTPLLFAFHGNGGEPESFIYDTAEAVEEGYFIGVYPAGLEYSWNLGPELSEADDSAFTDAILEMLSGTGGVDANKPVALGFSNGAGMVHELAMESPHFVGIAAATAPTSASTGSRIPHTTAATGRSTVRARARSIGSCCA